MERKTRKWLTVAPLLAELKAWAGRLIRGPGDEPPEVPVEIEEDVPAA